MSSDKILVSLIKTQMGKAAKEHRKKVAKRNAQIKEAQKKFQKMYSERMQQEIERIREEKNKQSQETGA